MRLAALAPSGRLCSGPCGGRASALCAAHMPRPGLRAGPGVTAPGARRPRRLRGTRRAPLPPAGGLRAAPLRALGSAVEVSVLARAAGLSGSLVRPGLRGSAGLRRGPGARPCPSPPVPPVGAGPPGPPSGAALRALASAGAPAGPCASARGRLGRGLWAAPVEQPPRPARKGLRVRRCRLPRRPRSFVAGRAGVAFRAAVCGFPRKAREQAARGGQSGTFFPVRLFRFVPASFQAVGICSGVGACPFPAVLWRALVWPCRAFTWHMIRER